MPLMYMPLVFSALADALVALGRVGKYLMAEELEEPYTVDYESKDALKVDGDFTWETAGKVPPGDSKFSHDKSGKGAGGAKEKEKEKKEKARKEKESKGEQEVKKGFFRGRKKVAKDPLLPTTTTTTTNEAVAEPDESKTDEEKPFELKNLKLRVPKGSFVAIVGRVGCGKVGRGVFVVIGYILLSLCCRVRSSKPS